MRKLFSAVPATLVCLAIAAPAHASIALANPTTFSAGPLGRLSVQGILSGVGTWQSNPETAPGETPYGADRAARFDINNAQVIVQKDTGVLQFYVQAGAYNFPTLGEPVTPTTTIMGNNFGVAPEAYITVAPSSTFSIEAGKLPTLIGEEGTWSWQNANIERGLLWNDENAVNRGVQINYARGPVAISLSWNDGFYSRSYHVLTGLASLTMDKADTVSVSFYHRFHRSLVSGPATPTVLNNSQIYDLMYAHKNGSLTVSPYVQYIYSPKSVKLGYTSTEHAGAAALLANYHFTPVWSLAGRAEYEKSSGSALSTSANANILGFGPGSQAWSLTLTPAYAVKGFFTRLEVSYVRVVGGAADALFGAHGAGQNQVRGMIESGVTF